MFLRQGVLALVTALGVVGPTTSLSDSSAHRVAPSRYQLSYVQAVPAATGGVKATTAQHLSRHAAAPTAAASAAVPHRVASSPAPVSRPSSPPATKTKTTTKAASPVAAPAKQLAAPVTATGTSKAIDTPLGSLGSVPPGTRFGNFDLPLPSASALYAGWESIVDSFVFQYQTFYGNVGVNTSMPIVDVPDGQATVPIGVNPGCNDFRSNTGSALPIPSDAYRYLTGSTDNPLILFQPSTLTEWELWQATYRNGSWSACWGGRISDLAGSAGLFHEPYGMAASGLSYLATMVTEADVASGAIDHPLAVILPLCNPSLVAPATRTDCNGRKGEPSEGTRFRLPSDLAMPAGLTPFAQMVFRTLQDYGAYVVDHAGAVMISAESPADWSLSGHTGPNPMVTSWAGHPEYTVLNGIPWSQMQVVAP